LVSETSRVGETESISIESISIESISIDRVVAGGAGMGRLVDGRVAFVQGALPGEVVTARVNTRKGHVVGEMVSVERSSTVRVAPPCPHVAQGCGGCDWQHVSIAAQSELKVSIVADALRRIGKFPELADSVVFRGRVGGEQGVGWRTTVRAHANADGQLGFLRHASNDVVPTTTCMVAHPRIAAKLASERAQRGDEVVIRTSVTSGETVVSSASGSRTDAVISETVGGHIFRVSARSFFQSGPQAADLLLGCVMGLIADRQPPQVLVDAYGGVGLFAIGVGASLTSPSPTTVLIVESSPSAVRDARFNLEQAGMTQRSMVHEANVDSWTPPRIVRRSARTWVIADPSRSGLGKSGVQTVMACDPEVVVLVSCDAAAGARDLRLLTDAGLHVERVEVLDLFPHTSHIEIVSLLMRT
jgi:23S rRNA (uracil1939-C5)-methyltransferase